MKPLDKAVERVLSELKENKHVIKLTQRRMQRKRQGREDQVWDRERHEVIIEVLEAARQRHVMNPPGSRLLHQAIDESVEVEAV